MKTKQANQSMERTGASRSAQSVLVASWRLWRRLCVVEAVLTPLAARASR